jgi:hypothetical protein
MAFLTSATPLFRHDRPMLLQPPMPPHADAELAEKPFTRLRRQAEAADIRAEMIQIRQTYLLRRFPMFLRRFSRHYFRRRDYAASR